MSALYSLVILIATTMANGLGGVRLYFTQDFVNELQHDWFPALAESLKGKVIPLSSELGRNQLPQLTQYLGSDFQLISLTIDYIDLGVNNFLFEIVPKNETEEADKLRISFSGVSYHLTLNYNMSGVSNEIGELEFGGEINYFNTTGYFEEDNQVLQVHPLNLQVQTSDFTYYFNSTQFILKTLNSLSSYVGPVLTSVFDYCLPVLAPVFEVEINKFFNNHIQNLTALQIPGTDFVVNLLMYELKVDSGKSDVEVTINGTFSDLNDSSHEIPYKPTELPDNYLTTDGLRLQLTSYSVNTLLWDLYDSGMLHIAVDGADLPASITQFFKLTTDWLNNLIPGMSDTFGTGKNCSVTLNISEAFYVVCDANANLVNTTVHVTTDFYVDGNPKQHAVTLEFDLDVQASATFVTTSSSTSIKLAIAELLMKNTKAENLHEGLTINVQLLTTQLNALLGLGKSLIGNMPFDLGLPTWMTFETVEIKVGDDFVEIALNPTKPA